jgi:hypothetical protein
VNAHDPFGLAKPAVDFHDLCPEMATEEMNRTAGSFFQLISSAWRAADAKNRQRLEQAFKPEFAAYAVRAQQRRASEMGSD